MTSVIVDSVKETRSRLGQKFVFPESKSVSLRPMSKEKKADLQSMLQYMPMDDREYLKSLINL